METSLLETCASVADNHKKAERSSVFCRLIDGKMQSDIAAITQSRADTWDGIRAKASIYLLVPRDDLAHSIAADIVAMG